MKRKFNKGPSFDYSTMIAGLILIGIGIWRLAVSDDVVSSVAGTVLIILGAIIFPGLRYNEIDPERKVLTRFNNFLFIKMPLPEKDVSRASKVGLTRFAATMNFYYKSLSSTSNIRSFDVFLELGEERVIVEETTDYEEAQKVMDELAALLNIPSENYFEAQMESLQRNRRR